MKTHILHGVSGKAAANDMLFVLGAIGFWLIAMAFFKFGRWWSRGDQYFIAKKFRQILTPSIDPDSVVAVASQFSTTDVFTGRIS